MTKQLYAFSIEPGDRDHMPGINFDAGVVVAEPEEIEQILRDLDEAHWGLLSIRPVDDAKVDLAEFRRVIGGGLSTYHHEVNETPPCDVDAPYLAAFEAANWDDEDEDDDPC